MDAAAIERLCNSSDASDHRQNPQMGNILAAIGLLITCDMLHTLQRCRPVLTAVSLSGALSLRAGMHLAMRLNKVQKTCQSVFTKLTSHCLVNFTTVHESSLAAAGIFCFSIE